MPEGDTIFRTARSLRVLEGAQVTGFDSSLPTVAAAARRFAVVGSRVQSVEARGKHLLIRFSSGAVLHTHQGMHGSWRLQRAGSARSGAARAVLETAAWVALCLRAPVVELFPAALESLHPSLRRLGPDLLAPAFDAREAVQRLRERPELPIGVAVMDQTSLAGVGNVYKSEVLFLTGTSPFAPVGTLDEHTLLRIVEEARRQLGRNLGPGLRRTTSGLTTRRLLVYRHAGEPCPRCGNPIEMRRQGEQARSTYFCGSCQRV
jgi:endonuclease-8